MNNELKLHHLKSAGQALHGDRWQTGLARDLGFKDGRRIRQWMSQQRPVPEGTMEKLRSLLELKQSKVQEVLSSLKNKETGNEKLS
ncbi:hypothetical protein ACRZ5S_23105 (plasmid) [Vibrio scophthalmi]|uniref:hypothetical protein n=1 Tax=Vibrio scophthalmi TaxID=45658 RepID=UPI003EBFB9AB